MSDATTTEPGTTAGEPAFGAEDDTFPRYEFRPRAFGTAVVFRLTPQALEWRSDSGGGRLPLTGIAQVRASFDPRQMTQTRWKLELWPITGPKVWFASASWVSLIEVARDDVGYRTFVLALHAALARAGGSPQYIAGRPAAIWGVGLVLAVAIFASMSFVAIQALLTGQLVLAAGVAALVGYYSWQMGRWFRRNQPRRYRPDAIPDDVLPPAA